MSSCNWSHSVEIRFLFGTASSLEFGSLHFRASHFLAQKFHAAKETFMVVTSGIGASRQALKPVKIKLSLK